MEPPPPGARAHAEVRRAVGGAPLHIRRKHVQRAGGRPGRGVSYGLGRERPLMFYMYWSTVATPVLVHMSHLMATSNGVATTLEKGRPKPLGPKLQTVSNTIIIINQWVLFIRRRRWRRPWRLLAPHSDRRGRRLCVSAAARPRLLKFDRVIVRGRTTVVHSTRGRAVVAVATAMARAC